MRFNNFVSDEEIAALRRKTAGHFERSTDQGSFDEYGKQEKVVSKESARSDRYPPESSDSEFFQTLLNPTLRSNPLSTPFSGLCNANLAVAFGSKQLKMSLKA